MKGVAVVFIAVVVVIAVVTAVVALVAAAVAMDIWPQMPQKAESTLNNEHSGQWDVLADI